MGDTGTFRQEVNNYLKHVIDAGQMKSASIENIDIQKEIAIAKVTLSDLAKQLRVVKRDKNGDLQLSFLTEQSLSPPTLHYSEYN